MNEKLNREPVSRYIHPWLLRYIEPYVHLQMNINIPLSSCHHTKSMLGFVQLFVCVSVQMSRVDTSP